MGFDCGGGGSVGSDALSLSKPDSGEGAGFGGPVPEARNAVEPRSGTNDVEDDEDDCEGVGSGMRGCGIETSGVGAGCCGVRDRTGVSPPSSEVDAPAVRFSLFEFNQ